MRLFSSSRNRNSQKERVDASIMIPRLLLLGCVILLLAIGLVMVYSASSVEAYNDYEEASYFLKRQAIFAIIGIGLAALVAFLPFRIWNGNVLWGIWLIAVLFLGATDLFGFVGLGSRRWIDLGFFTLQPSEFAKIAVMLLVTYLIINFKNGGYPSFLAFVVRLAVVVVIPGLLIFAQPDLGTTLILLVGVLAVLWFGEISRRVIFIGLLSVAILALLAVTIVGFRSDRLAAWLNPWDDPLDTGYQIINSYYAFSEGGIFGVGLGNSTQKYLYLTYAYNDFIFAIIGEEFGLIGAMFVVLLYVGFAFAAFRIGNMATDLFGKIITNSMAMTIVFQAFLNIACTTGLLPVTGKPLPFISYGGSSLISTMIMVGFILAVSLQYSSDDVQRRRASIRSYRGSAAASYDSYRQRPYRR